MTTVVVATPTPASCDFPQVRFNEMLFTHAGLSYALSSSVYLDWAASSFELKDGCRLLSINYADRSSHSIVIKYLPYSQQIKVRQPIKVSSGAKIRAAVDIDSYEVKFSANRATQQTRKTVYNNPTTFKFSNHNNGSAAVTVSPEGIVTSEVVVEAPLQQQLFGASGCVKRTVGNLPNTKGYLYEVSNVRQLTGQPLGYNNPLLSTAKVVVPVVADGLIPAGGLGPLMDRKNPMAIGWGLLYACGADQLIYVLLTLKGLVAEAKRRGVIEAGEVTATSVWGFEGSFIPAAPSTDNIRYIAENAFLGWSLCYAVRYLQHALPAHSLELGELKDDLKPLLLSLGYLCAYAVTPESGWCCERTENQSYNYGVLCRHASYYADAFFASLLELHYDLFIHQQAARLRLTLMSAQGVDLATTIQPFADDPEDVILAKAFWQLSTLKDSEGVYESILDGYQPGAVDPLPTKSSVGLAALLLITTLPTTATLPGWVTTYVATATNWFNGMVAPVVSVLTYLPLFFTTPAASLLFDGSVFDLKAETAYVRTVQLLTELRRWWPVGQRWGSLAAVNNVGSALGSLLNAEAQIYFDYFLLKELLLTASDVGLAQGDFLASWAAAVYQTTTNQLPLQGDAFRRQQLLNFLQREDNTRAGVTNLLINQGYEDATVTTYDPPAVCLLEDPFGDTFESYSADVNPITQLTALTTAQTNTFIYAAGQEDYTSDATQDLSAADTIINSNYGKRRRVTPGFTYRNLLVSGEYPPTDSEEPINQVVSDLPTVPRLMYPPGTELSSTVLDISYSEWTNPDQYVLDGTLMIKPMLELVPKITLNLRQRFVSELQQQLSAAIADGISYVIAAYSEYFPPARLIYVFAALDDEWRIDNWDSFNNVDYDGD